MSLDFVQYIHRMEFYPSISNKQDGPSGRMFWSKFLYETDRLVRPVRGQFETDVCELRKMFLLHCLLDVSVVHQTSCSMIGY